MVHAVVKVWGELDFWIEQCKTHPGMWNAGWSHEGGPTIIDESGPWAAVMAMVRGEAEIAVEEAVRCGGRN